MWYCSRCKSWNGQRLSECLECGKYQPTYRVLSKYIKKRHAPSVTFWDRLRAIYLLIRRGDGGAD